MKERSKLENFKTGLPFS